MKPKSPCKINDKDIEDKKVAVVGDSAKSLAEIKSTIV
jgi:hypothetical protein